MIWNTARILSLWFRVNADIQTHEDSESPSADLCNYFTHTYAPVLSVWRQSQKDHVAHSGRRLKHEYRHYTCNCSTNVKIPVSQKLCSSLLCFILLIDWPGHAFLSILLLSCLFYWILLISLGAYMICTSVFWFLSYFLSLPKYWAYFWFQSILVVFSLFTELGFT